MSVAESIECPEMWVIASSNVYLVMFVSESSLFLIHLQVAATPGFVAGLTFARISLVAKEKAKNMPLKVQESKIYGPKQKGGNCFP